MVIICVMSYAELNLNIKWSCGHRGYIDVRWLNKFVMEKDCELLVAVGSIVPYVGIVVLLSRSYGHSHMVIKVVKRLLINLNLLSSDQ